MREAFLDERDPQEEPGRTPSPGRWEGLAEVFQDGLGLTGVVFGVTLP